MQKESGLLQILGSVKLAKLMRGPQSEGNTPRSPRPGGSHAGDAPSDDDEGGKVGCANSLLKS